MDNGLMIIDYELLIMDYYDMRWYDGDNMM